MEAIEKGHHEIKKICHALQKFHETHGKPKKLDTIVSIPEELKLTVKERAEPILKKASETKEKNRRFPGILCRDRRPSPFRQNQGSLSPESWPGWLLRGHHPVNFAYFP